MVVMDFIMQNSQYPNNAIFLAFDFGMRNIGVAVGQKFTNTATPLDIIKAKYGRPQWYEITNLIKKWQPAALAVGVPINLDESENNITIAARDFIELLHERFKLPVHSAEERLTTKDARSRVFADAGYRGLQQEQIDSVAAKIILEGWMNQKY